MQPSLFKNEECVRSQAMGVYKCQLASVPWVSVPVRVWHLWPTPDEPHFQNQEHLVWTLSLNMEILLRCLFTYLQWIFSLFHLSHLLLLHLYLIMVVDSTTSEILISGYSTFEHNLHSLLITCSRPSTESVPGTHWDPSDYLTIFSLPFSVFMPLVQLNYTIYRDINSL